MLIYIKNILNNKKWIAIVDVIETAGTQVICFCSNSSGRTKSNARHG